MGNNWLLTDEEIEAWLFNRLGVGNRFEQFNRGFCRDLAKAQAKKLVEWLNNNGLTGNPNIGFEFGVGDLWLLKYDWQSLKKKVGIND